MVFVTGGTGLLGAHLLVDLAKEEKSIRALYRSEKKKNQTLELFKFYFPDDWKDQFERIDWVKGDILDVPLLEIAMKDCEHVYHCAGLVSFHKKDFFQMMKINREGTANILNIALANNVSKLCHVSSTAAIGGLDNVTITEETKWKISPNTSGYAISKYSAEKEVWRAIEEGLNAVIVNPCVILGAGNWNDSSLTIFKTLEKGIRYFPTGSNAIVDARDVSEIMIKLMKSNIHSERYLCIGNNQTFEALMQEIALQMEVKPPSKRVNETLVNAVRRFARIASLITFSRPSITKETVQSLFGNKSYDNSKIKNQLGFKFKSLKDTVANSLAGRIN